MREEFEDAMLDLETMGTGPNGAVIQIGLAAFNMKTWATDKAHDLLVDVDLLTTLMLNGNVDKSTVDWWRSRGGFKRHSPPVDIRVALLRTIEWFCDYPNIKKVWAVGPQFDVAVMEGNFRAAKLECPWLYNAGRDVRTVFELAKEFGWQRPQTEITHEAREDCRQQITALMDALTVIRKGSAT